MGSNWLAKVPTEEPYCPTCGSDHQGEADEFCVEFDYPEAFGFGWDNPLDYEPEDDEDADDWAD
jgi:hypothetical protein